MSSRIEKLEAAEVIIRLGRTGSRVDLIAIVETIPEDRWNAARLEFAAALREAANKILED